jgi:hypothetical protein
MNASILVGASRRFPFANGAWIPSTADEVFAEIRKAVLRAAADLRWGLDCFKFIFEMIRQSRAI